MKLECCHEIWLPCSTLFKDFLHINDYPSVSLAAFNKKMYCMCLSNKNVFKKREYSSSIKKYRNWYLFQITNKFIPNSEVELMLTNYADESFKILVTLSTNSVFQIWVLRIHIWVIAIQPLSPPATQHQMKFCNLLPNGICLKHWNFSYQHCPLKQIKKKKAVSNESEEKNT